MSEGVVLMTRMHPLLALGAIWARTVRCARPGAVAVVFGAGLAAGLPTPAAAQDPPAAQEAAPADIQVRVADNGLARKIVVQSSRVQQIGAVKQAQVILENPTRSAITVQYRPEWSDSSGFVLESDTRWEPVTIDSQMTRTIGFTGRSADAKTVVLYVKPVGR